MALTNTYAVSTTNKTISYVSGGAVDTVRDLYSWLMDTFDELGVLDDTIPMSAQTPTEFSLINSWFIDEETIKTLKGGAITTIGYNHGATYPNGIRVLTLDATANLSAGDIGKAVVDAPTGDSGTLMAYDTVTKHLWVRCDAVGDEFDDADAAVTVDGSACGNMTKVSDTGENIYANLYTLGTIEAGGTIYVVQDGVKITTGGYVDSGTGHIDALIKVNEFGVAIDGGDLIIFLREYGKLFDHFPITVTGGRNAVPLATAPDLNNTTLVTTVDDYAIDVTFGVVSKDLDNGDGANNYDVVIDCNGLTLLQMYEYLKYASMGTSSVQLDGIDGEQYISCDPAYAPVKAAPFGTFAGGKFFGARGVWIEGYADSDAKNFQLIDAAGDTQTPPNTVTMKVTALIAGDRVSVFRLTAVGGAINKDEFGGCDVNSAEATTLVMAGNITSDVAGKATGGIIRIEDNDLGIGYRLRYASWATKTFTLASAILTPEGGTNTTTIVDTGAFTAALCKIGDLIYNVTQDKVAYVVARNVNNNEVTISPAITGQTDADTIKKNVLPVALTTNDNAYSPFIDGQALTGELSNTLVKKVEDDDVPILVRVRKYGGAGSSILPFEIESLIEDTGKSIAAIRTPDSIVV
jgi:hypothetical protein